VVVVRWCSETIYQERRDVASVPEKKRDVFHRRALASVLEAATDNWKLGASGASMEEVPIKGVVGLRGRTTCHDVKGES
jgi:hypothetical protein